MPYPKEWGVNPRDVASKMYVNDTNAYYFSFGSNETNRSQVKGTTYKSLRQFIFPGTTLLDIAPQAFRIVCSVDNPAEGSIRLYDITNNNTIAEITGISGENDQIVFDSSLTNIPIGESILEIQAKTNKPGKQIYISSAVLKF